MQPVATHTNRHVMHSYFNTSPESPDGKYVVYFTSQTADGESGDIRIRERSTGKETVVVSNVTVEDAHRVACQQWSNDGKSVVYHDFRNGKWYVMVFDVGTAETSVIAENRQVAFGNPSSPWVPIYGCHWNPGEHRDLELVNVVTGQRKTAVTPADVVNTYGQWIQEEFGTTDVAIFFPIVSPDSKRVFFKMARPSGDTDFRKPGASYRAGKIVYDLEERRFIRLFPEWGHPSWAPDSQKIFEIGNFSIDVNTGKSRRCAPSCFSNHPSVAPNGLLFVTDANVTERKPGRPGDWAIAVGSMTRDDFVLLDLFGNTRGARSWRPNHPHPVFSADGQRIYYNVNEGRWTTLMVAATASR